MEQALDFKVVIGQQAEAIQIAESHYITHNGGDMAEAVQVSPHSPSRLIVDDALLATDAWKAVRVVCGL